MKFADPKSDIAFKKVFGNENKHEILISFLNAVLDLYDEQAIAEIAILNPYQAPKVSLLKEANLDTRAKTRGGITFIVEMQVEKQDYFAKRALYYTTKAYVGQIEKSENYPKLNQVIFIGILDFCLFDSPHYLSTHLLLDKRTFKQEIRDLELNFIELPKFEKTEDELTGLIEKWIYFFKHAGDLTMVPASLTEPHEITEAFEILEQHTWTRDELDIYDYWMMKEAGHKDALETARRDGKREGSQEGMTEGIHRVAQEMLRNDVPLDDIMKRTGLSRKDLETLQE